MQRPPALDIDRLIERNNLNFLGNGARTLLFAHGFGCDQVMWRFVAPAFAADHRVVLMDHVGSGASDRNAYRVERYNSLQGYADDILEICEALDLRDAIFVGHSVSAMIGLLAERADPRRFACMVMVAPSPRYINDEGYVGGFERPDVEELLDLLDRNHVEWSSKLAPLIMGNAERPELTHELASSFCQTDPLVARQFARVTFMSDTRSELAGCRTPCLILQCRDDVIAPLAVGDYLNCTLPDSELVVMQATGHCPHLSAPQEIIDAIRSYMKVMDERAHGAATA